MPLYELVYIIPNVHYTKNRLYQKPLTRKTAPPSILYNVCSDVLGESMFSLVCCLRCSPAPSRTCRSLVGWICLSSNVMNLLSREAVIRSCSFTMPNPTSHMLVCIISSLIRLGAWLLLHFLFHILFC
jgi:hypothetical protein